MKANRKTAAEKRREVIESVARKERELWELSELDQRILANTLHAHAKGILHDDRAERQASFWDAWDCLCGGGGVLKKVASREINGLLATCASGGIPVEKRACAALLLAKIATAIANGGDAAAATQRELEKKLAFLEVEILREVVEEFPPPQRIVFVSICAPCGFARDALLARVPESTRSVAARIFAGDHEIATRALDDLTRDILGS